MKVIGIAVDRLLLLKEGLGVSGGVAACFVKGSGSFSGIQSYFSYVKVVFIVMITVVIEFVSLCCRCKIAS